MNKKLYWSLLIPVVISPLFVVVACTTNSGENGSDGGSDSDTKPKTDLELATQRVVESLETHNMHLRTFSKPSAIRVEQLKIEMMHPSLNFGFVTKLEKIAADDTSGTLTLKVNLTRAANETKEFVVKVGGFLTNDQARANTIINPQTYFNDVSENYFQITLLTKKPEQLIPKDLNEDLIKTLIDVENPSDDGQNNRSVLLKKALPADLKLEITNIKQVNLFGVEEPAIQANLKLVKGDLKTGAYLLSIAGFQAHDLSLRQNSDYMINIFDTVGKLVQDPEHYPNDDNYVNKKASEIKTVAQLKPYLTNYGTSEQKLFTIKQIIENSANDQEGSLKIEISFKNSFDQSTKDQVIKVYGFQPVV